MKKKKEGERVEDNGASGSFLTLSLAPLGGELKEGRDLHRQRHS